MVALRTGSSLACTLPLPHPGVYVALTLPTVQGSWDIEEGFVQGPVAAVSLRQEGAPCVQGHITSPTLVPEVGP